MAEKFRGIRPAFGYPACPDHSEKFKLFELLEAPKQGITLTEHGAMMPAASVSGFYFSHPQAKYFNVGRIGRDQAGVLREAQGRIDRGGGALAVAESCLRSSGVWREVLTLSLLVLVGSLLVARGGQAAG